MALVQAWFDFAVAVTAVAVVGLNCSCCVNLMQLWCDFAIAVVTLL